MVNVKRPLIILGLITLLGAFLRFWNLGSMPPSLNWDEVSHGYNAYSILKTGRDEWGVFMPHIFRAFGDYKLPVYIYLTTFSVWLFGLTPFAVRFVSALAGTLAIPGIYLFTKELFKKHNHPRSTIHDLPTLVALLLATSPWHFFISRPALEANLSLTFLIYGGYFLLRYFENTSSFLPATILFSLSLHTYNTARIFVPLLLLVSLIIYHKKIALNTNHFAPKTFLAITILLSSLSLVFYQVINGDGTARYEKLKILSEATVYQIGQARLNSDLPPAFARLVHNRPVYFLITFAKNYLGYFSPQFFFQSSGSQSQFAIPNTNLLTIPVFLLAIVGFFLALTQSKSSNIQFLLVWLFFSPVAAALTVDPPQALRPNPMIPALIIFAAFALTRFPKLFQYLLLVLVIINFSLYLQNYFGAYRTNYSQSWQYGYEKVMKYVGENKTKFDRVFITKKLGEPHIFYSFYNQIDPQLLQPGGNNIRFQKSDWFWTDKIENVYFVNDWDIPLTTVDKLELESGGFVSTQRSLLVTSSDHLPINCVAKDTINFLNSEPAFIICSIP